MISIPYSNSEDRQREMREMLALLRARREADGSLNFDEVQATRLLVWIASAIDKVEQQDRILEMIHRALSTSLKETI